MYASTRSGDSGHEDGRTSFVSLRPYLSVLNRDRRCQLAFGVLYVRPPATPGAVRDWRNCLPRSVLFSCLTRRLSELAATDDPVSLDDKLLLLGIIFQHRNNRRSDAELLDSLRGRAVSQPNTLPKVKTLRGSNKTSLPICPAFRPTLLAKC